MIDKKSSNIIFYILQYLVLFCAVCCHNRQESSGACFLESNAGEFCDTVNRWTSYRYLLYDVNPPEGFNLRRDVYMRLAIFVKHLEPQGNWKLVLPPWPKLYHWQSIDVGGQDLLPWSTFFDTESLGKFIPIVEMTEFFKEFNSTIIDKVYFLQHPEHLWESGNFKERYYFGNCPRDFVYRRLGETSLWTGNFWGYPNISAVDVKCLSFHGHVSLLSEVLHDSDDRTVMIDHAEIVLHDNFGDQEYWQARRSMRFSQPLVHIAAEYRKEYLRSDDELDCTVRPEDWREEKDSLSARGGPYLCVHLRRKDFLWARPKEVPSIKGAAHQISELLQQLQLDTVFVATDAPKEEVRELKRLLKGYQVLIYRPTDDVKNKYKDGGVAIIEQIICSHARFFIGTYESTFSFRIQEEREIMRFPSEMTFNRLCGDGAKNCSKPSEWKIVF